MRNFTFKNGVGASVVNALSEKYVVEVCRDGWVHRQEYLRGEPTTQVEKIKETTEHGTKTHFWPDPEIFTETTEIDCDVIANRLREMAFLNKGLKLVFHDEKIEKEDKKEKQPLFLKISDNFILNIARKVVQEKFGYICRQMYRDIKTNEIEHGYAYNSGFDIGVFGFCCEWYKVQNPLDNVQVHDIWGFVSAFISNTEDYKFFCETNELFTESGNYSASAESVYKYITRNLDFVEEHTALADSEIECEILFECVDRGANLTEDYKVQKVLARETEKELVIKQGETETKFTYTKKTCRGNTIYLK